MLGALALVAVAAGILAMAPSLGAPLFWPGLVGAALLLCRAVLHVAGTMLGGEAGEKSEAGAARATGQESEGGEAGGTSSAGGRVWHRSGAMLLGAVALPLLLVYLRDGLHRVTPWPAVTDLIDLALLIAVAGAQAGVVVYAAQGEVAPAQAPAGRTPARLAAVLALVPALLGTGAAAANPYEVARLTVHNGGPGVDPVAVAWPPGLHPVIVTMSSARFCDDDECRSWTLRTFSPAVMDNYGTVGIGADGSVAVAALTGGQDNGGPFIHYGRCTRDGCEQAWLPVRVAAEEFFAWPELAVTPTPGGGIAFALAMPNTDRVRVNFIRCQDMQCSEPERHQLGGVAGRVHGGMDASHGIRKRARLTVLPDGRPVASFWIADTVIGATCEPVGCADPRLTVRPAGADSPAWAPLGGVDDDVVSLSEHALHTGPTVTPLAGAGGDPLTRAIAVSGTAVYVTMAVPAVWPSRLRPHLGAAPQYWQQVLWRCPDAECTAARRIPLGPPGVPDWRSARLAVSHDGRVLVVTAERIILAQL